MECPVCQTTMVVFEYQEIELDYCVDCKGVWFDAGEIELLFETLGLESNEIHLDLNPPEKLVTEARRRCPLCDDLMDKVSPYHRNVILDQCPNGDGIWFDAGEIRSGLAEKTGLDGSKRNRALEEYFNAALIDAPAEEK